jgi:hypothetical protein
LQRLSPAFSSLDNPQKECVTYCSKYYSEMNTSGEAQKAKLKPDFKTASDS